MTMESWMEGVDPIYTPSCTVFDQTYCGSIGLGYAHDLFIRHYCVRSLQLVSPKVSGTKKGGAVPLYFIGLFWGWGFPYISRIHTAYIVSTSILGT